MKNWGTQQVNSFCRSRSHEADHSVASSLQLNEHKLNEISFFAISLIYIRIDKRNLSIPNSNTLEQVSMKIIHTRYAFLTCKDVSPS
jgi:hypothetical protein